ncbi:hypothetical protein ABFS82_03G108100 [Erythranthe guttata]|nr:PREDICTED: putative F-box protein At2g02030 [Erythranthe guttata]|eukprot:XP_012854959.1 PREDICTED: putative F-box protein At2g02030 [Erythranthe guttata]
MDLDFFRNLPPEITIDTLSRLPIRTIIRCRLVCKSWRNLIQTREFADSHLSKSASGIVITSGFSRYLEIYEFVDELDLESHELHYNPVTEFNCDNFIESFELQSSAKGLLFFGVVESEPSALHICNPLTREFIQLPNYEVVYSLPTLVNCGFGVSKITGQYKVVRIVHECICDPHTFKLLKYTNCVCHVYTLGTGTWRKIAPGAPFGSDWYSVGVFLNGSLYWLVTDFEGYNLISCFDLETEIFSTFPPPSLLKRERRPGGLELVALGDYLCVCDNTSDDEIVMWLMKECGDEKSWTKDFVVRISDSDFLRGYGGSCEIAYPIKVFKDGDILMVLSDLYIFYYSNKTKTTTPVYMLGVYEDIGGLKALLHSSSFLSLETSFPIENVRPF